MEKSTLAFGSPLTNKKTLFPRLRVGGLNGFKQKSRLAFKTRSLLNGFYKF